MYLNYTLPFFPTFPNEDSGLGVLKCSTSICLRPLTAPRPNGTSASPMEVILKEKLLLLNFFKKKKQFYRRKKNDQL